METKFKSLVAIASFALAFGAFAFLPTQSTQAAGPTINVCPGSGSTCAKAESNGTTVTIEKASGGPGATVQL